MRPLSTSAIQSADALYESIELGGRGDPRTRRGKIFRGTNGLCRATEKKKARQRTEEGHFRQNPMLRADFPK
eukprot:tig00020903_g15103.t1